MVTLTKSKFLNGLGDLVEIYKKWLITKPDSAKKLFLDNNGVMTPQGFAIEAIVGTSCHTKNLAHTLAMIEWAWEDAQKNAEP